MTTSTPTRLVWRAGGDVDVAIVLSLENKIMY